MLDPSNYQQHKEVAENLKAGLGYVRLPDTFIGTQGGDVGKSRSEFFKPGQPPVPIDRYNTGGLRRRRLGKFIHVPFSGYLESIPPTWNTDWKEHTEGYFQSFRLNPDQGGKPRQFAALLPDQYQSFFLRTAIETCAAVIPRKNPVQPEYVNVHIVQVVATPGQPGVSSPPVLHRDGEWFTFAFLMERHHIVGGENIIATLQSANKHPFDVPDREIIARFTLERPWEGYVVDDHRVSHFVDHVILDEASSLYGWRTILLIDFTPAIPDIAR